MSKAPFLNLKSVQREPRTVYSTGRATWSWTSTETAGKQPTPLPCQTAPFPGWLQKNLLPCLTVPFAGNKQAHCPVKEHLSQVTSNPIAPFDSNFSSPGEKQPNCLAGQYISLMQATKFPCKVAFP